MNTKNRLQTVLILSVVTILTTLFVGVLTLTIFRGVYVDPNPMLSLISYALDFNRSIYVWLFVFVVYYLIISTRWDQITALIETINDKKFPKTLSIAYTTFLSLLVGALISFVLFLLIGTILWDYSISMLSYAEIHGFSETIIKISNSIYDFGMFAIVGMWSIFTGVVVVSFILVTKIRKKGSRTTISTG